MFQDTEDQTCALSFVLGGLKLEAVDRSCVLIIARMSPPAQSTEHKAPANSHSELLPERYMRREELEGRLVARTGKYFFVDFEDKVWSNGATVLTLTG